MKSAYAHPYNLNIQQFLKCIFFLLGVFVIFTGKAQSSQGINYQAIARDTTGSPIVKMAIAIDFKIHKTTASGAVVYDEKQSKTTNQFGLFTAIIGQGTVVSGVFTNINWGASDYFLEVLINNTSMGTMQFMSVPYALHSTTAGTANPIGVAGGDLSGTYPNPVVNTSAITTTKIADNAIDGTKISLPGETNGSLMYNNGADWVALAPGTVGNILQSNASAVPSWVNPLGITNFSSGNLPPLFTTTVNNPTTAPTLSFSITNAGANTIFGNPTSISAAPTYFSPVLASSLFNNQGTSSNVLHGNAAGNPTWGSVNLTSDVSNILPLSNGGTNANLNPLSGGIVYSTANSFSITTAGTGGEVLTSNGTAAPIWKSIPQEVTGGAANYLTKWLTSSTLTTSVMYDNGSAIGIGTTSPDNTSLLDINSTNKGILIPRMNSTQMNAITPPANASGLMIYNNDSAAFCYFDGTRWTKIFAGTNGGTVAWRRNASTIYPASLNDSVGIGIIPKTKLHINDGHIKSTQSTMPTITTISGQSATLDPNSTDVKGVIIFPGTISGGTSTTIKVNFSKAYNIPPVVIVCGMGASSSGILQSSIIIESTTTTDVTISIKSTLITGNISSPKINYIVIE